MKISFDDELMMLMVWAGKDLCRESHSCLGLSPLTLVYLPLPASNLATTASSCSVISDVDNRDVNWSGMIIAGLAVKQGNEPVTGFILREQVLFDGTGRRRIRLLGIQ